MLIKYQIKMEKFKGGAKIFYLDARGRKETATFYDDGRGTRITGDWSRLMALYQKALADEARAKDCALPE